MVNHQKAVSMTKQRTAHQIIKALVLKGYCYRQLSEWSGLLPNLLHTISNDETYDELCSLRDRLNNLPPPTEKPRWADRIKRDKAK